MKFKGFDNEEVEVVKRSGKGHDHLHIRCGENEIYCHIITHNNVLRIDAFHVRGRTNTNIDGSRLDGLG